MGNSGLRLGLAVVGAVVGSFVGMPQLGLLVGSLLGSFLFPDKGQNSVATGSRVAGINLMTSTYGSGIPILYGTRRIAGNVLWNAGLRENQATDRTTQGKGGGGGSSQTSTTYQYFWTGAIAFCEGTAEKILRLWANGTVIYDATKPPVAYGPDNAGSWNLQQGVVRVNTNNDNINPGTTGGIAASVGGNSFRFYPGSETQLADPALVNFLKSNGDGSEQFACPYRGICYIVFDDIPLEQFGNRIPNIEAEITMQDPPAQKSIDYWTPIPGTHISSISLQHDALAMDWNRGFIYVGSEEDVVDATKQYFRRVNLYTLREDLQLKWSDINTGPHASTSGGVGFGLWTCGDDGFLYTISQGVTNIVKTDMDTYKAAGNFGNNSFSSFFPWDENGFKSASEAIPFLLLPGGAPNVPGYQRWLALCVGQNHFGVIDALAMENPLATGEDIFVYVDNYQFQFSTVTLLETSLFNQVKGIVGRNDGKGQVYVASSNSNQMSIYTMQFGYATSYSFTDGICYDAEGGVVITILPTDIDPAAVGFVLVVERYIYDHFDDSIIVMGALDMGSTIQKDFIIKVGIDYTGFGSATGRIVWKNTNLATYPDTGIINVSSSWQQGWCVGGKLSWFIDNAKLYTLDTMTGTLVADTPDTTTWAGPAVPNMGLFGAQIFDGFSNTIHTMGNEIVKRANLGLFSNGEDASVSDIVKDICSRVGLDSDADIDVSDLADMGYTTSFVILQPTPATDPLSTLAQTFFFAVTESDFKLKFVPRGGTSVATVTYDKLSAISTSTNAGDYFQETRTQDVEMPRAIQVNYTDRSRDYQPGSQQAQRPSLPDPTMYSQDAQTVDLTQCVISDTYALEVAEKTIYVVWQERSNYVTKISWEFIYLDPTDIVTWQLLDGSEYAARIAKADIGADLTQSISSNSEDTAHYAASGRLADSGAGFPQQLPPGTSATRLFLFDCPLLRDIDDTGRLRSTDYWGGAGFGLAWPGCTFYSSADGQNFGFLGTSTVETKYGFARTTLPDADPYCMDIINSLTVAMATHDSDLESCTYADLMGGANAAILANKSTFEIEIIQYQDAVQNDDGTWTLTNLLRGRRGTDPFTGIHGTSDIFIPLNMNNRSFQIFNNSLNILNQARDYRAVGFGQLFENGDDQVHVLTGADLKPYAPTNPVAQTSGSDIDLSWTRRTRINGAWKNFSPDVPLNEDTEKYEVDILSGPGGSVLRTLTSTTDSVTYTSVDITTDFGSPPATLSLRVYQISAQVGRGRTVEKTVDVLP